MSFKKFINEANEAIKFALKHLDIQNEGYTLTEPTKENFGDLSCNVAFLLTKRLQKSPSEIASILAEQCRCYIDAIQTKSQSYVLSVVAHESGYINFKGDFGFIGNEIHSRFFIVGKSEYQTNNYHYWKNIFGINIRCSKFSSWNIRSVLQSQNSGTNQNKSKQRSNTAQIRNHR